MVVGLVVSSISSSDARALASSAPGNEAICISLDDLLLLKVVPEEYDDDGERDSDSQGEGFGEE